MAANGCGPARLKWVPQWLLDWVKRLLFNWFFKANCNRHDEGYQEGGDEIRRFECDWKFWLAMRRDTLRQRGLKRLLCWLTALVFFVFVRALGWMRFRYRG